MYRKKKTKAQVLSSSLKPVEIDGNKKHNYTRLQLYGSHLIRAFNHLLAFAQKIFLQAEAHLG